MSPCKHPSATGLSNVLALLLMLFSLIRAPDLDCLTGPCVEFSHKIGNRVVYACGSMIVAPGHDKIRWTPCGCRRLDQSAATAGVPHNLYPVFISFSLLAIQALSRSCFIRIRLQVTWAVHRRLRSRCLRTRITPCSRRSRAPCRRPRRCARRTCVSGVQREMRVRSWYGHGTR